MPLPPQLEESWKEALASEWAKPYFADLAAFVADERRSKEVYPPKNEVFCAFDHVPFDKVQVVVVGQDPYHGPGQAHGLCFSVRPDVALPPSLKNIFRELKTDLDISPPSHGCLLPWAKQGILLLNATLTVRAHQPRSHYGQGWELFTDSVVARLASREDPVVFVLWGKSAQEKCQHILNSVSHHHVLTAPHPSPFSAHSGFFGCRHFSKINELLKKQGKQLIDWQL